jgi:hypothetical protein
MEGRQITGAAGISPSTPVSHRKSNFIIVACSSIVVPVVCETPGTLLQT